MRQQPAAAARHGVGGVQLAASILDHVNDAVIATDLQFHVVSWNPAATTIYGWSTREALGNCVTDLIPVQRFLEGGDLAALLTALQHTSYWKGEVVQRHRDGRELIIESSSTYVRDAHGTPAGYVSINRDITARKQAEAALRRSEQDYRNLFERANDAILIFEPDSEIVLDVNPQACMLYGLSREAFIGTSLKDRSKDVRRGERFLHSVLVRGTYAGFETVQFRADGAPLYLYINASLIDYQGRRAILSINRDISERKRAEAAIQVSEATFRSAFDYATTGMALVALDGRYLRVNPAYTDILGYSSQELTATTFQAITPPDDLAASLDFADRLVAGAIPSYRLEKRYRHKQGHPVWVLLSVSLVRDSEGQPLYFIAQIQDNSEQKRAEQALRESEERLRGLVEATFEGVLVHDQGRILDANASFARMLGYDREELIGGSALHFAAPESRAMIADMIRTGYEQPYEVTGLRKDGSTFPAEIHAKAAPFQGRMVRVSAIRDLTARKQAEEERLALERKLQETQKLESLGVLAGGIAHDFNNLLAIILGNASLAQLQLPADSPLRPLVAAIADAARHGAELPRQMLAYSGRGPSAVESVDLNGLVQAMGHLLAASVSKNVTLVYRLAPELLVVEADPGQLRQVIMNLAINAAEAIGDRAGTVTVSTAMCDVGQNAAASDLAHGLVPGTYVCLTVRDTGCGMDPATQARIFEPFFSTKFIGRGLGLAAVAGIARGHNGAVTVQSAPGEGTRFTIWLPAAAALPTPAQNSNQAGYQQGGGGIMLVVDDEAGVREMAAQMLRHFGFRVLTAADGCEALAHVRDQNEAITCVLLDMTMPQMSVEGIVDVLRREHPALPVILMSGYSVNEVRTRLADHPVAAFLQKPFTTGDLHGAIMAVLTERDASHRARGA